MKSINKKNFVKLISITIATLLLCSNFLQMHFSSDTYVLYDLGYFHYPSEYFLRDGRLFSSLACYIGGFLHLPIPIYIIVMDFIGMILLSISIYILSKIIIDILKPQNLLFEILITIACHLLILNQYSLEYLLFPESAIMCMGVFFLIMAIKILVEKPKFTHLKIFLCLIISCISYQGVINIFPTLVVLVYIIKQIKENNKIGVFLKEFFIEMIKLATLLILTIGITFIIVKIGQTAFNDTHNNFAKIVSERTFWLRVKAVKGCIKELWVNCMHMLPKHTLTITFFTTLIILIVSKSKIQTYIHYIFVVALSSITSILSVFFFFF